ncbi:MAG TPA: hypothetical protein VHD83_19515 [Puia sp.]|nr:hypothetical protein [Puia sp.]
MAFLRTVLLHRCTLCMVLLLIAGASLAQMKVLSVEPSQTDPLIETVHGPHIAVYEKGIRSQHLLYLFFPGTGGRAAGSKKMDSIFAVKGLHAISLDYENNVVAVSCAHGRDSTGFDRYREEIITGKPVSDKVSVDSVNSILNRFQKLLVYLVKNDPNGGWDEFVKDDRPVWSKIIVAGHSQGSGHAAYIGKIYKVDRVLMFSGPQDYLDDLDMPAPWQTGKGATSPTKYYAFLNLQDAFNVKHQIANCMKLMRQSQPDTLMVKPGEAIHGHKHILVNDIPTKDHHGSTISPVFENVWEYMATDK